MIPTIDPLRSNRLLQSDSIVLPENLPPASPPESETIETPEPSRRQLWLKNKQDQFLSKLHELGLIDAQWLLIEPFRNTPVDLLRINAAQLEWMRHGEIDLIQLLHHSARAATMKGGKIEAFTILGSFAPHLLTTESLKETLAFYFSQVDSCLDKPLAKAIAFHDVDIRIEAAKDGKAETFIENFLKITSYPEVKTRYLFQPAPSIDAPPLDVENLKIGLADIVFCRSDPGENARTIFQTLRIDLIPLLEGDDCHPIATLQAVLDLWCGTGHWIKKNVDEWDFPAYIFMVTRGIHFPDAETETDLMTVCLQAFQKNPNRTLKCVTTFKKLDLISATMKTVYLLNSCLSMNFEDGLYVKVFETLQPNDDILNDIVNAIRSATLSITSLKALLQLIGLRALLDPTLKPVVPIELISHRAMPYLQFIFDDAHLLVPLDLKAALHTFATHFEHTLEAERAATRLIKHFSRGRALSIDPSSSLKINAKELVDWLRLSIADLKPLLMSESEFLRKIANLLFATQLYLYPSLESLIVALEMTCTQRFQHTIQPILHQELLVNHIPLFKQDGSHIDAAIQNYFAQAQEQESALLIPLLRVSHPAIFNLALTRLETYRIPLFEIVDEYLKLNKIDRVLSLLNLILNTCPFEAPLWQRPIDHIADFLTSVTINPKNYETVQQRSHDFSKLLLRLMDEFQFPFNSTDRLLRLIGLYNHLKQTDVETRLTALLDQIVFEENEARFNQALKDLESASSASQIKDFVVQFSSEKDKVLAELKKLLDQLHLKHKTLFLEILQLQEMEQFVRNGDFDEMIERCIKKYLLANSQGFDFVINLLNMPPFIKKELYRTFMTKASALTSTPQIEATLYLVYTNALFLFHDEGESLEVHMFIHSLHFCSSLPLDFVDCEQLYNIVIDVRKKKNFLFLNFCINLYKAVIQRLRKDPQEVILLALGNWIRDQLKTELPQFENNSELLKLEYEFYNIILKYYSAQIEASRYSETGSSLRQFLTLIQIGGWSKPAFQEFRSVLTATLETDQTETPDWLCDVFKLLVDNVGLQPRYSSLIDELLVLEKDQKLSQIVREILNVMPQMFQSKQTKTLPLGFIKILLETFDKSTSCKQMETLGLMILKDSFLDLIPTNDLSHLLENFFYHYLRLLLVNDGPLMIAIRAVWHTLKQDYRDCVYEVQATAETQAMIKMQYMSITESFSKGVPALTTHFFFNMIPLMVSPTVVLSGENAKAANLNLFSKAKDLNTQITNLLPPLRSFIIIPNCATEKKLLIMYGLAQALFALDVDNPAKAMTRDSLLLYLVVLLSAYPSNTYISFFEHFLFRDISTLESFETIIHRDILNLEIARFHQSKIGKSIRPARNMNLRQDFYFILFGLVLRGDEQTIYKLNQDTALVFIDFILEKLDDPHSHFCDFAFTRIRNILLEIVNSLIGLIFFRKVMLFYTKASQRYPAENFEPYLLKLLNVTYDQVVNRINAQKQLDILTYYIDELLPFTMHQLLLYQNRPERYRSDAPYNVYFVLMKFHEFIKQTYPKDGKNRHFYIKSTAAVAQIVERVEALIDDDLKLLYSGVSSAEFDFHQKYLSFTTFLNLMSSVNEDLKLLLQCGAKTKLSVIWASLFRFHLILLEENKLTNVMGIQLSITILNYWIEAYQKDCNKLDYFINLSNFIKFLPGFYKYNESAVDAISQLNWFTKKMFRYYLIESMHWIDEDNSQQAVYCINQFLEFYKVTYPPAYDEILDRILAEQEEFQPYLIYALRYNLLPDSIAATLHTDSDPNDPS